ncbi:MAG TPA: hypothetical protein VG165_06230 [Solirubrobacteraceae bacterium]|jgi:hypothetical protein|nr:hypothetical protein [Solirubrobacteraceae bacterium]
MTTTGRAATDPVEIDWATAEVHDGDLKVSLTAAVSEEWRDRLDAVLARLDHSGTPWGPIRPTKRRLKVAEVTEGGEAELRHFLEAAVQQTNADLAAPGPDSADPDAPDAGASPADQRMTDAFRAAAAPPPDHPSAQAVPDHAH